LFSENFVFLNNFRTLNLHPRTGSTEHRWLLHANGDGLWQDSWRLRLWYCQAFRNAWKAACSLDNAVFLVPAGRRYKVGAITFMGPCKNKMIIQVMRRWTIIRSNASPQELENQ
jgi:hypothetical protein